MKLKLIGNVFYASVQWNVRMVSHSCGICKIQRRHPFLFWKWRTIHRMSLDDGMMQYLDFQAIHSAQLFEAAFTELEKMVRWFK